MKNSTFLSINVKSQLLYPISLCFVFLLALTSCDKDNKDTISPSGAGNSSADLSINGENFVLNGYGFAQVADTTIVLPSQGGFVNYEMTGLTAGFTDNLAGDPFAPDQESFLFYISGYDGPGNYTKWVPDTTLQTSGRGIFMVSLGQQRNGEGVHSFATNIVFEEDEISINITSDNNNRLKGTISGEKRDSETGELKVLSGSFNIQKD